MSAFLEIYSAVSCCFKNLRSIVYLNLGSSLFSDFSFENVYQFFFRVLVKENFFLKQKKGLNSLTTDVF